MPGGFVQIVRCPSCGRKYRFRPDTLDEELPDCPACGAADEPPAIPVSKQAPNMPVVRTGNATRAADLAQRIVAEDYGLTDLRVDNLREGDISAPKMTPDQQDMAAAWQGTGGSGRTQALPIPDTQTLLGMARAANAVQPAVPLIGRMQRAIKRNEEGPRTGRGHLMREKR